MIDEEHGDPVLATPATRGVHMTVDGSDGMEARMDAIRLKDILGEPLTEQERAHLWRLVLDRGADDQPPALPSPTTIAGMKFQLGRRIREASIQYLGFVYGKPGKRGRFKIGDAPPIELGPADSLPNGATVSLLSDRFAVLRLCAQPELVVALALHGREPPCADLEIWH